MDTIMENGESSLSPNIGGSSSPSFSNNQSPVVTPREKPQGEESVQTYTEVKVDSTHKVTDHYNVLEKLGGGTFGQVFKLTHKVTGHVYAGKFFKGGHRTKEREAACKEIELMNHLDHNKLVRCLAAYDLKPEMVMVMEFITGGELFERIVDDNFEYTEPAGVGYMQQILEGIGYMHQKNIVHLDMKPENIVCVDHTSTSIKIIDFGMAKKLDPNTPLKVMCGTPEYVAPEVLSYDPVCLASDMWSIGVICYLLLSGESPFQGNSDMETMASVTAAQWKFDGESFEDITEQAQNFISSLLKKDGRRRLCYKEALAHPWMATFNSVDSGTTKSLSKEKMKNFLARQKWRKAGNALRAITRLSLFSKVNSHGSPTSSREEKPQGEESVQTYTEVKVDSTHKVTDHYNVLEKLGGGTFGQVFKLTHKVTGHVYAGKFFKCGHRTKEREAACKEIELMNHLDHNKLVRCLAAYDLKPEMVMVMEFITGGELFERIVDDNFEYTEPAGVGYMQQILEGIGYMHQKNIVHLDMKPENIVCVDHTSTSIKIIDFGMANKLDPNTPLKVMCGTLPYMAPEVLSYDPVCLASDMWSIGVICYILLSGESPFQGNSDMETMASVTAAQWKFDGESFEDITEQAQNFISSLLKKDGRRRLCYKEALAHPWMATFNSGTTKSLSKEKMKNFLARQKWRKAGNALRAITRLSLFSKVNSHGSPTSSREDCPLTPETEQALQSLELGAPQFSQRLQDQTVTQGSRACLSCHLQGYPGPEVIWLCGEQPVVESSRVQIEYEDDGHCTLVLAQVDPGDANIYTCKATNDQGEAVCSAKLIVKE